MNGWGTFLHKQKINLLSLSLQIIGSLSENNNVVHV